MDNHVEGNMVHKIVHIILSFPTLWVLVLPPVPSSRAAVVYVHSNFTLRQRTLQIRKGIESLAWLVENILPWLVDKY